MSRDLSGLLLTTVLAGCATAGSATRPSVASSPDTLARTAIAEERARDVAANPERTVAIPPLGVAARDTSLTVLGYGLADLLMTDLSRSHELTMVERARLDAVTRELRLADAGAVDSATAPRVGRLVGARRLIIGTVSDRGGGEFTIDVRIASTTDGSVTQALSARAPARDILRAEKVLAMRLFEALGVALTPQERLAVEQRPTESLPALLAYSEGVRDEARGDLAAAVTHFRDAAQHDAAFSVARARLRRAETSQRTRTADGRRAGAVESRLTTGLAMGAINASPAGMMAMGMDAMMADRQMMQMMMEDRAMMGQSQATFATVIVHIHRLP